MTTTRTTKAAPTAAEQLAERLGMMAQRITTPRERAIGPRERRYQAERDLLVAVLSRIWPSHIMRAARKDLIWRDVVCVHSPAGPLAWGLAPDRAHWFEHLKRSACKDRHSASERDARLRKLLVALAPAARRSRKKRSTR